ncbi:serine/threonine protein phosphatase [Halapricum sp. CBA1109]|uniref:metallophosphoesterase family protein n=1 Tax=Halapricum sp. CBA1109 TaxID=2668068 RepID=UPI0012FA3939|nr:metallophosphoesterase family protein [Halapricum sp. CBA1109]MUV90403.1 serine/threonine protein phosphatase [Halapricum sp. CBA1109]
MEFAPDITHRRIDASAYERVFVVGDVHGCRETLDRLLDRLGPDEETLFVFVGDLVRKGPDSAGVLDRVRSLPNAVSVLGNNEAKILRGDKNLSELTSADHDHIESMPEAITFGNSLVVHGGVDHRKPVVEHTREDLLTMRSLADDGGYTRPFWFETRPDGPRVFFGHTVLDEPFATETAVGLDTGCVYGGQLTAYDLRNDRFVAVEPEVTHQSRSADSIVDPSPR